MGFRDVDLVRQLVEEFPNWKGRLRWSPLQVKVQGRWWQVRRVKLSSRAVGFDLGKGRSVRFPFESDKIDRAKRQDQLAESLIAAYPGFQATRILTSTDRIRHHSAAFLRIQLERGNRVRLLLAADQEALPEERDRLLVSALLWWNQLQLEPPQAEIHLYIPDHWPSRLSCFLSYLKLPVSCRVYSLQTGDLEPAGRFSAVAPGVCDRLQHNLPAGHLDEAVTVLPAARSLPEDLLRLQARFPDLDLRARKGNWELCFRGFPLLWKDSVDRLCMHPGRPVIAGEGIEGELSFWLDRLRKERVFPPATPLSTLYTTAPERWLESLVVKHLDSLIPGGMGPVYAQVPTYLGGERKVLDLLSIDSRGRLVVLELKVEKELGLIFQALDYWRRVKRHLEAGDFAQRGYFPGWRLDSGTPRIILVAPLFEFHPIFPILKRYLREEVCFECIGVSSNWRSSFRVLSRFSF